MTRATLSRLTTNVTITNACYELIAGGSNGCWVRRVEVYLATAVASQFGFGRPAAKGITPTTPVRFQWTESADPVDPTVIRATTALAWGTGPTVPTNFFRQVTFPNVIGSGVVWDFAVGKLFVPAGGSLVLWNVTATGTACVNVDIEE